MTREAVIVSTARTGLAKSGRGGFNMTHGAAMAGHAVIKKKYPKKILIMGIIK